MGVLVMIGQLLLSLTLLVFVHEFGHFAAAKLFGIRVRKFYIFFDFLFPISTLLNFALFKTKKGDTEYGIGWFPLGGYVDIEGMVDETTSAADLNKEPQPWEFRAKPAWQRLIVMLGGIIMNIITAIIIFTFWTKHYEQKYLPMTALKDGVYVTKEGEKLGLKTGDKIVMVNGKKPERFNDAIGFDVIFGATLTIDRNGETKQIELPGDMYKYLKDPLYFPIHSKIIIEALAPNYKVQQDKPLQAKDIIIGIDSTLLRNNYELTDYLSERKNSSSILKVRRNNDMLDIPVLINENGKIGLQLNTIFDTAFYKLKNYSLSQSFVFGIKEAVSNFLLNMTAIKKMGKGEIKAKESVGGPISMATMFGNIWDWGRFWKLSGMISMGLAFMNLLPIPALDGGHIVILLYEMITRRKVSDKAQEALQKIGTAIILLLMVLVFYNDIMRLLGK